jgi:two-component system cell cycle sensor histidine kinase/response regulator CckA
MGSPGPQTLAHSVVLVVDDEDMVREYMARVLANAGHQVVVAHDGLEAWAIAETYGEGLQLVVTDVRMPGLTGTELAAHLKERWPSLPVLFVTGGAPSGDPTATPVLRKPFTGDALTAQVRALLATRH